MEEVTKYGIIFIVNLWKRTNPQQNNQSIRVSKTCQQFFKTKNILYIKSSNPNLDLLITSEDELTSGHHAGE